MARRSSRQLGERFAKLPIKLLKHPAVTTLPHAAFRVLTIFAAGYNGVNNGSLCCTDTWMKQFGIVSRDTTYAAIRKLVDRKLIEVTRPGIKHRKVPTLYALTWQPVNSRNGDLLGRFSPASHAYQEWQAPARAKKKVPDRRKNKAATAEIQSDDRTSISPMVGQENADFSPISPTKDEAFQSDGREYSRNLGRIPRSGSASDVPSSERLASENAGVAKIRRLDSVQPHLTHADVAKITGEPIELVRQVRAPR